MEMIEWMDATSRIISRRKAKKKGKFPQHREISIAILNTIFDVSKC